MAEQFLQAAQIHARSEQVRGKAVPQRVWRCRIGKTQRAARAGDRFLDDAL